MSQEKGGKCCL